MRSSTMLLAVTLPQYDFTMSLAIFLSNSDDLKIHMAESSKNAGLSCPWILPSHPLTLFQLPTNTIIALAFSSKFWRAPRPVWGSDIPPLLGLVLSPDTKSIHMPQTKHQSHVALREAPTCEKDVHRAVSSQPAWSPSRWHSRRCWQPAPLELRLQTCEEQNAPGRNQFHKHTLSTTL